MVQALAGRYGLPVVQARDEIRSANHDEDYWRAIYNRAVYLADYRYMDEQVAP
jgi:hypothetical protein